MACKVIVNYGGSLTADVLESKKKAVADALGVCCEDVIVFPKEVSVSIVEVPHALTAAREKADKDAEHEAEKAAKEQAKAEADAAKAAAKAEKAHA